MTSRVFRQSLTLCLGASIIAIITLRGNACGQEAARATAGQELRKQQTSQQLRVAAAQIPVSRDIAANVETIGRAIDKAILQKADVLLTPEGSLSGYTPRFDQTQVQKGLDKLVARARAGRLALALGTCFIEPDDGRCYDEIRFYDGDGNFLGFHTKILRCGSMTAPTRGEINDYAERPLRTFQLKGITIGGLICNDMWANPSCTPMPDPHLSQQLASKGAKIIFHAVNGGRDGSDASRNLYWPFHESNLRIRAAAGKLWIVTADNCAPTNIPCSAPSGVLRPDGHWAVKTSNQGEQLVVYTINLGGKRP